MRRIIGCVAARLKPLLSTGKDGLACRQPSRCGPSTDEARYPRRCLMDVAMPTAALATLVIIPLFSFSRKTRYYGSPARMPGVACEASDDVPTTTPAQAGPKALPLMIEK